MSWIQELVKSKDRLSNLEGGYMSVSMDEMDRLLLVAERAEAFIKADVCKAHRCGKYGKKEREALILAVESPLIAAAITIPDQIEIRGKEL